MKMIFANTSNYKNKKLNKKVNNKLKKNNKLTRKEWLTKKPQPQPIKEKFKIAKNKMLFLMLLTMQWKNQIKLKKM